MNDEMALLFRALGRRFPLKACGAFVECGDLVCGDMQSDRSLQLTHCVQVCTSFSALQNSLMSLSYHNLTAEDPTCIGMNLASKRDL